MSVLSRAPLGAKGTAGKHEAGKSKRQTSTDKDTPASALGVTDAPWACKMLTGGSGSGVC